MQKCLFTKNMQKYISVLILLFFAKAGLIAQTFSDDNFIYTISPKKAVQSANLSSLTKEQMNQTVQYVDGLGRPIQTIAPTQGGNGEDLVTPMAYDEFGRQVKEYLSYAVSNGGSSYGRISSTSAINAASSFYNTEKYENTPNPFSQKKFEPAPLNKVLKQAAPGESWAMDGGHAI